MNISQKSLNNEKVTSLSSLEKFRSGMQEKDRDYEHRGHNTVTKETSSLLSSKLIRTVNSISESKKTQPIADPYIESITDSIQLFNTMSKNYLQKTATMLEKNNDYQL